jgi:hypothetical protein
VGAIALPSSPVQLQLLAGDAFDGPCPYRHDLEPRVEIALIRVHSEPGLRCAPKPSLLLGTDHLEWIAEATVLLCLHLAEDEPTASAHDQVELVTADPRVRSQDAIAPQPVVPQRAALRARSDRAGARPR